MPEQDPTTPPAGQQAPATPPAATPPATEPTQEQHVPYERFKTVNDQLKSLKEQLKALNGEKEQQTTTTKTLEDQVKQIQNDLTTERAEKLRLKVASAKQLPPELVDRLRGTTEAELAADADALLALIKKPAGPGVPPPGGGGKPPAFDLSGKSAEEIRKARREGKI